MADVIEAAKVALGEEMLAASAYRMLATLYHGSLREKLARMAEMEEKHAEFWRSLLEDRGIRPELKARWRLMAYAIASRLLGLGLMLKILEAGEKRAIEMYSKVIESPELSESEKSKLERILEDELVHEEELEEEESKLKRFLAHVREAVLGMNDGLVEVLSVTAGLAGAYNNPLHVALGGMIVGVAGSLSMAIGEYVSVKSQRQVREEALRRVKAAARHIPHALRGRIAELMLKKGYSRELSEEAAREASVKPELLAMVLAEEEHGVREEALESPGESAAYTGLFYILGAFIPLFPYILGLSTTAAIPLSLMLASLALASTGFIIAVSAGLSPLGKIAEMVAVGLGAAAAVFTIGRLASLALGVEI